MSQDKLDDSYFEFCQTERQREVLSALIKAGTDRKAAQLVGVHPRNLQRIKERIRKQAALKNFAPSCGMTTPLSDVEVLKGRSYLEDKRTGEVVLQWSKTNVDLQHQIELAKQTVDELATEVKRAKPTELKNKTQLQDLLNLYILTDFHLGMLAWKPETGADWDLKTAEETCLAAFGHLVATSPSAKTGFFVNLGDFLHYDSMQSETPKSRHVLDSDSRQPKIIDVGWSLLRKCVSMLLQKHERVVLLMARGNHDEGSCSWLQVICKSHYENEPRIDVIVNPKNYYAYKHGEVLLGFHHGHKKTNLRDLRDHFYEEFREWHGSTVRTYLHTGHLHHNETLPSKGRTTVQRWPTIAARDAYGADYASDRYMPVITYNLRAEIGRSYFYPEMM